MDQSLLAILACPLCKGKLIYDAKSACLICRFDHLAYPIKNGVPVMIPEKAEKLKLEGE